MNWAFKGFFTDAASAEVAYHRLLQKQLVYDLETSDLGEPNLHISQKSHHQVAPAIAYALEGNTMLATPSDSIGAASSAMLSNNDPQAALIPFLEKQEKASEMNAFYLYGHCRKKDLDAVKNCLRNLGAFSVLTTSSGTRPRFS